MLTADAAIERTYEDYQKLNLDKTSKDSIRSCCIHVKVSNDGLLLTDSKRSKFFRKHYASDQISYCTYHQSSSVTNDLMGMKLIGIVSKKSASNTCVLLTTDDLQSSDDLIRYISMVGIILIILKV